MHGLEQELRSHAGALRALALRLVGPAHAEDLVQETSLLAWTQRPDERGGLGAWLRSVLRHRAGKLRRGEARRARREQSSVRDGEVASPADVAQQREAMGALHAALMALSAPYQGVLLQRFFQDLTPTAIAERNGVPIATVKSQLQRGLALLRERLDADGHGNWRSAFAETFGLPLTTAVVAGATGAVLMSTKIVWLGGAVVAASLCVAFWPEVGAAPPAVAPGERAVVAAATSGKATSEQPQRHEVIGVASTAAAVPAAPMRIRLVDAFDGAPLPGYWVRLQRPLVEGYTMTQSDQRGELEIDGAWREQEMEVVAIDDASVKDAPVVGSHRIRAGDWLPAGERLDVPFAVGPTYRVLFDVAPPEGDLEAVLIAGDDIRHAEGLRQRLRPGPVPWVRFSADNANVSSLGDGPWSLVVFGKDWVAIGAVQQIRGVQTTPVLLRGRACGNLRIDVMIDGPRPREGHRHTATVYALDATGTPIETNHRTFDAGAGATLPVGRYRVFVGGPDQQLFREDVVIEPGATILLHANFRAATERLTLQVVMRSQTGTRQVGTLPDARRVGGTELVPGTYRGPGENGASVYEFVGLPPGEWDVSLGPTPHLPPWDATRKRVSANVGTVEFVCLDAGAPPPGHAQVRVVDAAKKQPIAGAGVTTLLEGMHFMTQTGADGVADLGPCLAGQSVPLLVRACGYAPALLEVVAGAEESPPHEVALHPGWGTLLMVVQPDPSGYRGKPLPGVRVLVDGVAAGTTDARGFLLLSTAARPARLEFLHDDYVHQHGGADAVTGAPDGDAQHAFFIVMEKKKSK